jgi:hypothetical protein
VNANTAEILQIRFSKDKGNVRIVEKWFTLDTTFYEIQIIKKDYILINKYKNTKRCFKWNNTRRIFKNLNYNKNIKNSNKDSEMRLLSNTIFIR